MQPQVRDALMEIWNPWVQPFKDLGDGAGKLLDSLGEQLLGLDAHDHASLGDVLNFDREKFRLAARSRRSASKDFGVMRLNETRLEAFLGFSRREFVNPSEEQKNELVERDGKWWRADEAVFGLRIFTVIEPGLQNDPLLKKVMPGSPEPDDDQADRDHARLDRRPVPRRRPRRRATRSSSCRSSSTSRPSRSARSRSASCATPPRRSPASSSPRSSRPSSATPSACRSAAPA